LKLEVLGLILIFLGFALAFVAALLPALMVALQPSEGVQVSGGGCIVILFFPICFGYGALGGAMLITVIALAVILVALTFAFYWITSKAVRRSPEGRESIFRV